MESLRVVAVQLFELFVALVTTFPTWALRRPVNLTGFFPIHHATCHVAPEVQQYETTLYQQLKLLRSQPKDHYHRAQRVSATVAVFRGRDRREPEILLLQSRRHRVPGSTKETQGKWEMTGGGVDMLPHETTLRAAEREARDEAGIEIASIDAFVGDHYFHLRWALWIAHNVKIMFIGQVKGGDVGLRNIKLNYFEHERFCWATERQLGAMTDRPTGGPKLTMHGDEARPTDEQWAQMQYISKEAHQLALRAFDKLREQKRKER